MGKKIGRFIAKNDAAYAVMRNSILQAQSRRTGKASHIPQRPPRMLPVVEQESGTD
ncbi:MULTISPECIES: hypothetical protein [unclassified Streptomyces]|uniref:hypothetical protein n=1 Tax=unclassified Streptomyces TaxID=2593676 RepID=UPI0013DC9FC2|nr:MULTISPECIES: hypothetical protein [unclassified Streptomyces]